MNARELRSALALLGLSQAELGALLGRTPNTITRWVNDDRMPVEVRMFCRVALDRGIEYAKEAIAP
jgi:transcriptional regulator with XRE-family HTH domain